MLKTNAVFSRSRRRFSLFLMPLHPPELASRLSAVLIFHFLRVSDFHAENTKKVSKILSKMSSKTFKNEIQK